MRNLRELSLLLTLLFSIPSFAESETPAPTPTPAPTATRYIPSVNHFTVATPGAQWLNVSRPLKPEDLNGRIVLLDFWTYCCVNCMQTLPEIAKLENEFKKEPFLVVGVHSAKFDNEKDTDNIRQAMLRYGVEHPVVNDRDFRIWKTFDVRSWPTLVLLKPNGDIDQKWVGEGHTDEIRKRIAALTKEMGKKAKDLPGIPYALERDKAAKGEFFYPSKLAYDESSKTLFVSDSSHHQIAAYTWDPKNPANLKPAYRIGRQNEPGLKNGSFTKSQFRRPQGLAIQKNTLYVADTENHVVRKIDLKSKTVSTIAGTGKKGKAIKIYSDEEEGKPLPAKSTDLASPWDLAFHPESSHLVIAMAGTHQLWSLDLQAGKLEAIAGTGAESIEDGLPTENTLAQPSGLSSLLGSLYFVDAESSSLRFYFEGYVRTLVGSGLFDFGMKDGERKKASLQHPLGLYADVSGVYITDTYNHAIRRYDPQKQMLETLVGDGNRGAGAEEKAEDGKSVRLNEPSGITKVSGPKASEELFIVSDTNNHRLLFWNRTKNQLQRIKVEGEKSSTGGTAKDGAGIVAPKRMSIRLPNTIPAALAKVNRTNPEVKILLPEMHKLNEEGPSYARLFEGMPPKEVLKQEWSTDDLKKDLTLKLKDLKSGTPYVLQGTFYFCVDAEKAVCEIASISQPIEVDSEGQERLEIRLQKGKAD